jgi:hypothetical protein
VSISSQENQPINITTHNHAKPKKQKKHHDDVPITHATQHQVRYMYNDGKSQQLPRVKKPAYLQNAHSKIRKNVSYFKSLYKDKNNYSMFDKEPQVLFNEHPASYNYDQQIDSSLA